MARSLSGSQRRNLIRQWGRAAVAANQSLVVYLRALHEAATAGVETGAQRAILSTANAGQSVTYGLGDAAEAVSQAGALTLLAEVLDVAEALTGTAADDAALIGQLVDLLGTPIRASVNRYQTLRL